MARKPNAWGKVPVSVYLEPGLFDALVAAVDREGLTMSIVIRRAIMHELGVDAQGQVAK